MFLHLGQSVTVPYGEIVGIFDLDNITYNVRAAQFVNRAEREGRLVLCTDDLPKTAVVCGDRVYLSQLSAATLKGRVESGRFEEAK